MIETFKGAAAFNHDISSWNTRWVTEMDFMFEGATSFNQDISTWDVSRVEDMQGMFKDATHFIGTSSQPNLENWATISLVNGRDMFSPNPDWDQVNPGVVGQCWSC